MFFPFFKIDITHMNGIIRFLEEGQRLKNPKQAPNYVASIMSSCWKDEPNDRPTFDFLEEAMESLLVQ